MSPFIHEDFLLQSEPARKLYHDYASSLPIVDYHNHLAPDEIHQDKRFRNLTEIWLRGDHYKWRAMRTAGVDEHYITGEASSDLEKFLAWAKTVPQTLKNPLYHWTHLELKRYFDIDLPLNEQTAGEIWEQTEALLQKSAFSTRSLLKKMNVHVVCTTDDAVDTLEHHKAYAAESEGEFVMYPTFRPDKAMKVEEPESFRQYIKKLEEVSGIQIDHYTSFLEALRRRHDYFDSLGCRASDHGIEEPFAEEYQESELNRIFGSVMSGSRLSEDDIRKFKSALMHEFALMDHEKGWAFQMHIGAMRNNNTRAYQQVGPDSGFDSIGDSQIAKPLALFLDRLEVNRQLPKTVIYNLNPSDNATLATMIGNFMGDGIPGKIQHGPAWWFHDQKEGMEDHLQTLANMSLLSRFVGMVTDSRSILSLPRHEYYRRVLCNMLGNDIEQGIIPSDYDMIGQLLEQICYRNALEYFSYVDYPGQQK
ncbi:glucuronate isomerase [Natronogracilivirga saccharolytica]|uniref:Uronate isomerase n=1 Tax=Natronogracilivirga saccharolytica TaxID=2812953 RepID=A0A8J7RU09_9BACT|nr:glucuronate isomerase [Natronogracilivirga saccharolytica]MBP3193889.1 glucuronate isomerase [Natronogracilivirga saccharolytica]